jgi:hypothetical protein
VPVLACERLKYNRCCKVPPVRSPQAPNGMPDGAAIRRQRFVMTRFAKSRSRYQGVRHHQILARALTKIPNGVTLVQLGRYGSAVYD